MESDENFNNTEEWSVFPTLNPDQPSTCMRWSCSCGSNSPSRLTLSKGNCSFPVAFWSIFSFSAISARFRFFSSLSCCCFCSFSYRTFAKEYEHFSKCLVTVFLNFFHLRIFRWRDMSEKVLTYLCLSFVHPFSFYLPTVVFDSDGRGNLARIRLDLFGTGLLKSEVIVPLEGLLLLQKKRSLSLRVIHILLYNLVVGGDPEKSFTYLNGWFKCSYTPWIRYTQNPPVLIFLQVSFVKHVVTKERLFLIQLRVVPVIPQVFLESCRHQPIRKKLSQVTRKK